MSQYGSPPPPSDPPDDDGRTRIPGADRPGDQAPPEPAGEWERPTQQAGAPAGGSWDQPQQGSWDQPAPPPAGQAGGYQGGYPEQGGYQDPAYQGGYPEQGGYQDPAYQQGGYGGGQYGGPGDPAGPAGPGGGWSGGGFGGAVPNKNEAKGFLGALFDFSFSTFVTPMIVKFVYILALVALGLGFLAFLVTALVSGEVSLILITIIVGPLVLLVYICFIRMTLELYLGITRMSQDINRRLPES